MVVTEHRVEEVICPCCQERNHASFPAEGRETVQYGAQVKALSVYLHQHHLLPFAWLTQVLGDLLGTSPAAGTIVLWLQEAAELVIEPVAQIKVALRQSALLHCDETGLYIAAGERVWLHVAATAQLTCYELLTALFARHPLPLYAESLRTFMPRASRLPLLRLLVC